MFEIKPYESAGPIRFGMSSEELVRAVGDPARITRDKSGELGYEYSGFRVVLSSGGVVCEIGFLPNTDVVLEGVQIFSAPDSFARLVEKDGDPYEFVGFIILLKLGITVTGFHDNDESQKAVTVFEKGRWDAFKAKLRKFRAPRVRRGRKRN